MPNSKPGASPASTPTTENWQDCLSQYAIWCGTAPRTKEDKIAWLFKQWQAARAAQPQSQPSDDPLLKHARKIGNKVRENPELYANHRVPLSPQSQQLPKRENAEKIVDLLCDGVLSYKPINVSAGQLKEKRIKAVLELAAQSQQPSQPYDFGPIYQENTEGKLVICDQTLQVMKEAVSELNGMIAGLEDVRDGRVKSIEQIRAELRPSVPIPSSPTPTEPKS